MIRTLATLVAGVIAAIVAAGAAARMRRRSRVVRRAERRSNRRTKAQTRPSQTRAASAASKAGSSTSRTSEIGDSPGKPSTSATARGEAGTTALDPAAERPSLRSIKGIGDVTEERLRGLGVTSVAHIGAWSDEELEQTAARIHVSAERIRREDWVGQARRLAGAS